MGERWQYENGEVHDRPDVYGDTGPAAWRIEEEPPC